MYNHIITLNTAPRASMKQVMLATGISMAFYLCLRSSEYVSRTVIPIEDSHQFLSADVEFMLNDESLQATAFRILLITTSKWSNSACCTLKIYGRITAFPYGFPH